MAVALEREASALDFALSASLVPDLAHPGRRQRESIPSQTHHLPRASVAQDLSNCSCRKECERPRPADGRQT